MNPFTVSPHTTRLIPRFGNNKTQLGIIRTYQKYMPNYGCQISLWRNKILVNQLVRASMSSKSSTRTQHTMRNPSNRPLNCRYCKHLNKSVKITSSDKKRENNPLFNVNCQSSNHMYLITCKLCGYYVGQTTSDSRLRISLLNETTIPTLAAFY